MKLTLRKITGEDFNFSKRVVSNTDVIVMIKSAKTCLKEIKITCKLGLLYTLLIVHLDR